MKIVIQKHIKKSLLKEKNKTSKENSRKERDMKKAISAIRKAMEAL
jgi:hypothetical protein